MSEGMLAAITGLAALIIGALQWWFSMQAAAPQRDAEVTGGRRSDRDDGPAGARLLADLGGKFAL